jgi:hypothetical protein
VGVRAAVDIGTLLVVITDKRRSRADPGPSGGG